MSRSSLGFRDLTIISIKILLNKRKINLNTNGMPLTLDFVTLEDCQELFLE